MRTGALAALVFFVGSVVCAQGIPPLVNYQGLLSDASGQPLATAQYTITFRLYDSPCAAAPCAGGQVWGPQIFDGAGGVGHGALVSVVAGSFNVVLGPQDTGGNSILGAFSGSRYLSIQVGSANEILPRQQILAAPFAANGLPAGTVLPFSGATVPAGFLPCDGAAVSRTTYASLFAALGTIHGAGNGSTTFNLPDCRGRVAMGMGQGPALSDRVLGTALGEESHVLSLAEMPPHQHQVAGAFHPSGAAQGGGYTGATTNTCTGGSCGTTAYYEFTGGLTTLQGDGAAHNTIQPSLVLNYIVKY